MPPKKNKRWFTADQFFAILDKIWIRIGNISKKHTRHYLYKSIWLFFPSIIFLFLAYFFFWRLTQGKDLMVITLEDPKGETSFIEFLCFVVALVFWVYVTWYSTRLVARAKEFQQPDESQVWKTFLTQTPRILAFSCITIILLAFFQLDDSRTYGYPYLNSTKCYILLIVSYIWYFLIYELWVLYTESNREKRNKQQWIDFLKNTRKGTFWSLVWFGLVTMCTKSFWSVFALLIALQIGLVLVMIVRKELDEVSSEGEMKGLEKITPESTLLKRMKYIIWHDENRRYVRVFLLISGFALIFYFAAIINVHVAVFIGPFPFILLAFGVLLGFGNILTFLSVLKKLNFHLIFFILALAYGIKLDSHKLQLPDKAENEPKFSNRQTLPQYLDAWLHDPIRKAILDDSTKPKYPVYFVMANGGASRSGYWTAKILSGLEDVSGGKFSNHLFCLSGASGGSVGNATFFCLLKAKDKLAEKNRSFSQASAEYLESDFLTYTLSHLLGPDIFRNIFPFINWFSSDRGRALTKSLERAPSKDCFLFDSLGVNFSSFITQQDSPYRPYPLPVLCINVTRMQDGNPAVFSNIRMSSGLLPQNNFFNNRIDILDMLKDKKDIKLSTAVTLGASFPYISPAGRIDLLFEKNKKGEKKKKDSQYFVDGGYFDNSGAGVVNEMIFGIRNILDNTDTLKKYKDRLEFFVLHIMNTDPKQESKDPINSMTNDLLAPFKTMLGSYGKQTTINDERLKSYLRSINDPRVDDHYKKIDLYYDTASKFRYSMNWVISQSQLNKMDTALFHNKVYNAEKKLMAEWIY